MVGHFRLSFYFFGPKVTNKKQCCFVFFNNFSATKGTGGVGFQHAFSYTAFVGLCVGFLSLEEIDETEYGLIPEPTIEDGKETPGRSSKPKKRKRGDDNSSSINEPEGGSEDKMEKEEAKVKEKKKRKKDKTKKPKKKSEAVFG